MKSNTEKASTEKKTGTSFVGLTNNLGNIITAASAKTKDIVTKAQESIVNVVDKNGNGKIDTEDFVSIGENLQEIKEKTANFVSIAGQSVKSGSEVIGKVIGDAKIEMDRKYLRPVFSDEMLLSASNVSSMDEIRKVQIPSIICIVKRDKKRSENVVCSGSVGYRMTVKGVDMLYLFEDSVSQLGMRFYPAISETIYYLDPYQDNFYICLDDYFDYLKKVRVNELEVVAQDLGAKRVQITFKEHKKAFFTKSARVDAAVEKVKISNSYGNASNEYSSVEVAADVKFSGQDTPVKPKLVYFKNESDIEKLVQMRTENSKNKIESKTYRFQCNKSSGIKEKDAARIDAVLYQLKCSGTATISSEAQRESRTELEYSIEF